MLAILLGQSTFFEWGPLKWLAELLGGVVVLILAWLLFPAVATMVMGFFLEQVVAAVEAANYPGLPPARPIPVIDAVIATLRLVALAIFLNLLALPLYIMAPGLNFFVFLGLNGYLFGRQYFEVVALRRLAPAAMRAVRSRHAGKLFAGGVIITGMFAVPVANLVAPLVAVAMMVHIFEGLRWAEPDLLPC